MTSTQDLQSLLKQAKVLDAQTLKIPDKAMKAVEQLFQIIALVAPKVQLGKDWKVKYPVFDIVQYGTEPGKVLRKKSIEVPDQWLGTPEFIYFIQVLLATVVLSEFIVGTPGVGLSAVQVGVPIQVFLAFLGKTKTWELVINPEIEPTSAHTEVGKEGCLSIEKGKKRIAVPRYKKIKLKYTSLAQSPIQKKMILKGFDARVVQHEFDHLLGKLIIDYS